MEENKTLIQFIIEKLLHYGIVFIRMTVYYIVKLIYYIFNLKEIDLARERGKLIDNNENLESFKHEFVFDKSDLFIENWSYYRELVAELDIPEENKAELIQYVLQLVAEAERQAFNTTYNYLRTKDMREPSFQDMIIQGIFQNNSNVEPREKLDNPYYENLATELRHKRKFS